MKTITSITKAATLFAFVAFANVALASGNLRVNILPLNSERAVVAISNTAESNFQISVENMNGELLYYKETTDGEKDYRKVFDFSRLDRGDYRLIVAVDGEKTERNFTIDSRNIAVGKAKSVVDPYFSFNDKQLKISYLNFDEANVNVYFYNRGELIYSKKVGKDFNVNTGFDLSKLNNGDYKVVLSTNDNSFAYDVRID